MCANVIKESRIKKVYYNLPRTNESTATFFLKNNIYVEQILINDNEYDEQNRYYLQNFFKKRR